MLDNFYAFKFIFLLTQKWEDSDAYKLGIIDAEGNELKKKHELNTYQEKDAFTRFHRLVYRLKRMLQKVPFAKSTIGRYATAIALIKEEFNSPQIEEKFILHLKEQNIEIPSISQLILESSESEYKKVFGLFFKEGADNELELVTEMVMTTGFDMPAKKLQQEQEDETFAGSIVFTCDTDTFTKCRTGKRKFARYKTYVGEDEIGQKIRAYGNKYPKKCIILKNSVTGGMLYLRRGKGK